MSSEGLQVSVGSLAQVWQEGDINFRFTGRSSALEGIRGHQSVQKSRGESYQSELSVALNVERNGFAFRVQGRVDGYNPELDPVLVEEIKTLRVQVESLPYAVGVLHRAQLRIYGHLLAQSSGLENVQLRLCYFNLDDRQETWVDEILSAADLESFFEATLERFSNVLKLRQAWRLIRDQSIQSLGFPYSSYRPGQREMAVAAFRSLSQSRQVVLQAPTGIGKTMATIFPAVKTLPSMGYDTLFYLSAKTSGQQMAEKTVAELLGTGYRIRAVTITAKEKICFNKGSPCDPEHCEFARGYYDRLAAGIEAATQAFDDLNRRNIEAVAQKHQLCPFELSLDLSQSADIVICDYNYVFDPAVYLRRFFEDPGGKYAMLVDEAHNLVDRGRDMFSAELTKSRFLSLRRKLKLISPPVARSLARVNSEFLALRKSNQVNLDEDGYALPGNQITRLENRLRTFVESAELLLRENQHPLFQDDLLTLYFDCLRFLRTAEQLDENYAVILTSSRKELLLKLFCINPATRLREGFEKMAASICFSATMKPQDYFQNLIGLAGDADWFQLHSPFDPANLGVFVTSYIGTGYRDREGSLTDLVRIIKQVADARNGNYLVFFPSYAYLETAFEHFQKNFPGRETIVQSRVMSEQDRHDFLNRFVADGELIGFAVMGGIFGEAVDLKGTRLVGVVVVGVGLPQIGIERDLIRSHWEENRRGFEFAYQYPGMNRVLQTAGRVIRDTTDKGVICLVDRRFAESRYQRLFPGEWQVQQAGSESMLAEGLGKFWDTHPQALS